MRDAPERYCTITQWTEGNGGSDGWRVVPRACEGDKSEHDGGEIFLYRSEIKSGSGTRRGIVVRNTVSGMSQKNKIMFDS